MIKKLKIIVKQYIQLMENNLKIGFYQNYKQEQIPILFYPHITQNQINKLRECKKFRDYIEKINQNQHRIIVKRIQVSCILMFSGDRIGYVTIKVIMTVDGRDIQQSVFIRGASVAVLLFVNQKLIVVEQYRVPAQKTFLEPPAGMIDQSGDLTSKAMQQLSQQTGIKIKKQMLTYLGSTYPSSQICDEQIYLYYCKIKMEQNVLKQLQNKQHGEVGSQQRTIVRVIEYDPYMILGTGNSAFISLACLYQNHIRTQIKEG